MHGDSPKEPQESIRGRFWTRLAAKWSDPNGDLALVRRLFAESFPTHRSWYIFALICMAVVALATALSAWLMRYVVNDIFVAKDTGKIWLLSLAVIGMALVKGFANYGQVVVMGRIGTAITLSFQRRLVDKLVTLPIAFFSKQHSSKFIMRISRGARATQDAVILISTSLGRDLLTVLGLGCVMVMQDVVMSLIALSLSPAVIVGVSCVIRKIRELDTAEFQTLAAVIAATQETVLGMPVVKAFSLQPQMQERVGEAASSAAQRANRINAIQATASPLMETLGGIVIALVILYAGWQTATAGKTPGEFMAFLTAFLLAYEPTKRLARMHIGLQRNLNRVRLVYDLLDRPDHEPELRGAKKLDRAIGHVVIRAVDFGYTRRRKVLHNVTIEAKPGSVVALVGPSGAGKSTIVNLVQRLYDPWKGDIEIDGVNIREVTLESLRRNISIVSQETFLFSGTVYENIAFGRANATEQEVRAAADAALATEFILAMPDGFQSEVGEKGGALSGGQRQRIAIARAILKDAPILLLDEATSALDPQSEREVRSAIQLLMQGCTTIVIAHRLSTIIAADVTYVIDAGHIIESGSHRSLIRNGQLYAKLFGSEGTISDLAERWELAD